eukprot:Hpha_TRINITY_DN5878_c0_g1::TRINITY_DN5878_c0_g1_i1::g.45617::m.45617
MGELQLFARLPEGDLVPICCTPDALVDHLMEEVRQAAGLRAAPKLRFLDVILDALMPVADTNLTSEAVVEVVQVMVSKVPIAAGAQYCMALVEDGARIVAWGNNLQGQCNVPDLEGVKVLQISGGAFHSIALMEDQTLRAWV